ncbi:UPF0746 protein DDB_G0281095-like [Dendronephthya gigantea]|uniref:UPF0746 protein DDB_G0281095-like n=1 Tax=Dendronephthya gigantea TaxID=151771 RepID=UPI0010696B42|nr:UPF0746 protein DDB_G0281095-like [Dendronephthya gigantea]XP_028415821.1 UPF0746 protein DDB_G0281095-like [Dendronephthya gigantea]
MVWNNEKDKTLLKEMAAEGVMRKKPKSRDRGTSWEKVVSNLNSSAEFEVSQKSLRDRYKLLAKKYKNKMRKEESSTGGGGDGPNELESLLQDLIEMEEDAEQRVTDENAEKQNTIEADRAKAMEMRQRAMESFGETRERLQENDIHVPKKKRRSNREGMHALEKAIEWKQKNDEEERKAKAEERQQQLVMQEAFMRQLEATQQQQTVQFKLTEQQLLSTIHQQQQQQQQQVQQFAAMQENMVRMMEQQQRQTELILELFRQSNNN